MAYDDDYPPFFGGPRRTRSLLAPAPTTTTPAPAVTLERPKLPFFRGLTPRVMSQRSGEGGGSLAQRGYPIFDKSTTALQRAEGNRSLDYLPADEVARELAGLKARQTMVERGGIARTTGSTPREAGSFGPLEWGFREGLAANRESVRQGRPDAVLGDTMVQQYGPAFGDATVVATADRTGRFNQFSGMGSPAAARTPEQIEMAALQQQVNHYRSLPNNTLGRQIRNMLGAARAQRQLNFLRQQSVAAGQLGVSQGDLMLRAQAQKPKTEREHLVNQLLRTGEYGELERAAAAEQGRSNTRNIETMRGVYANVPSDAEPMFYPGLTADPNAQPVPVMIPRRRYPE